MESSNKHCERTLSSNLVLPLGRFDTQLPSLNMGEPGLRKIRVGAERVSRRVFFREVHSLVVEDGQVSLVQSDGSLSDWHEVMDLPFLVTPSSDLPVYFLVRHNRELWPLRSMLQMGQIHLLCMESVLGEDLPFEEDPDHRAQLLCEERSLLFSELDVDLSKHNTVFDRFNLHLRARVERKIPYVRKLDRLFFHSQFPGYSEAFRLLEDRPGRRVVLLDFNSMYPYGLQGCNFADPAELEYVSDPARIARHFQSKNPNGMFRCRLTKTSTTPGWWSELHPWRLVQQNVGMPWKWKDETLELLLHANEIQFLQKHFSVEVLEGVFSERSMEHPLESTSRALFQKRRDATDPRVRAWWKKALLSLHGVMNGHHRTGRWVKPENMERFFKYTFASRPFFNPSVYAEVSGQSDTAYRIAHYRVDHPRNIYSLMSQTLANSRLHLLKLFDRILSDPAFADVEICYCNIDSVHLSIPDEEVDILKTMLRDEGRLGDDLGQLKVEAEGSSGVWLDVGRYWIFEGDIPVYYRGSPSDVNPFKLKKNYRRVLLPSGDAQSWKFRSTAGVAYWKKVVRVGESKTRLQLQRRPLEELLEMDTAESTYLEEMRRSMRWKLFVLNEKKRRARRAGFRVSYDGKHVISGKLESGCPELDPDLQIPDPTPESTTSES